MNLVNCFSSIFAVNIRSHLFLANNNKCKSGLRETGQWVEKVKSYGSIGGSPLQTHTYIRVVLQKLPQLSDTHFSQILNKLKNFFFMVL